MFERKTSPTVNSEGTSASSSAGSHAETNGNQLREAAGPKDSANNQGEAKKNIFKKKNLFKKSTFGSSAKKKQDEAPSKPIDPGNAVTDTTSAIADGPEEQMMTEHQGSGQDEQEHALAIIEPSAAEPIVPPEHDAGDSFREVPSTDFFPDAAPLPHPYLLNARGDLREKNEKGGTTAITDGTPLAATALLRNNGGEEWGLETCHLDADRRAHTTIFPMSDIVNGKRSKVVGALADKGLNVLPDKASDLMDCIQRYKPIKRVIQTKEGGWLSGNFEIFALPNEIIGDANGEEVVFVQERHAPTTTSIRANGTLDEWQEGIADKVKGSVLAMFVVMASFLGPLLRILRLDGGGWHFFGPSSRGKSTLLQIGASVWGKGSDPGRDAKSLVQRWHLTGNALEAIARCHNDMATYLDELGVFVGDLGQAIYLFAGGVGKAAMDSHRRLLQSRSWIGCVFSSGEKTIVDAVTEGGKQAKAGQLVRMIDVPSSDIFTSGEGSDAASLVNNLKHACSVSFGTAGPLFIAKLIAAIKCDRDLLDNLRGDLERTVRTITPESILPEQGRMLHKFAAVDVVGRLAARFGVVPYTDEEIRNCVLHVRDLCLDSGKGISDSDRALWQLQGFLLRNHSSLPSVSDQHAKVSNAKAFCGRDVFLFSDEQLSTAAGIGRSGIVEFARSLDSKGLLAKNEPGRLKAKHKVASAGKHVRFYGVKTSILEAEFGNDDTDTARSSSVPTQQDMDAEAQADQSMDVDSIGEELEYPEVDEQQTDRTAQSTAEDEESNPSGGYPHGVKPSFDISPFLGKQDPSIPATKPPQGRRSLFKADSNSQRGVTGNQPKNPSWRGKSLRKFTSGGPTLDLNKHPEDQDFFDDEQFHPTEDDF